MDRGAWWATDHGVTKRQTRLSPHTCRLSSALLQRETHPSMDGGRQQRWIPGEELETWRSQNSLFWARSVSLATFVIVITYNGLAQRIPSLCLTIKLKCLCSEACLPGDGRKEEINTFPFLWLAIFNPWILEMGLHSF